MIDDHHCKKQGPKPLVVLRLAIKPAHGDIQLLPHRISRRRCNGGRCNLSAGRQLLDTSALQILERDARGVFPNTLCRVPLLN